MPTPCEVGTYADSVPESCTSILACKPCPSHATTSGPASSTIEQCICKIGYYAQSSGALTCTRCPADALCDRPNMTEDTIEYNCPWEHFTSGSFWQIECADKTFCNPILYTVAAPEPPRTRARGGALAPAASPPRPRLSPHAAS